MKFMKIAAATVILAASTVSATAQSALNDILSKGCGLFRQLFFIGDSAFDAEGKRWPI